MESPFKFIKRYFAKRRKLKKDFSLMLKSAVIRSVDTEVAYRDERVKRGK